MPTPPAETAGFGIRAVAYIIDALLLSFLGGAFPYLVIVTTNAGPSARAGQQVTTSTSGSVVISLIYFLFFWSWLGGGRTLGMRVLGLRVIAERDSAPIGLGTAFVRWIGLWLSFAACFVGVIWVAFDRRHQGWHDQIARTLVVRA